MFNRLYSIYCGLFSGLFNVCLYNSKHSLTQKPTITTPSSDKEMLELFFKQVDAAYKQANKKTDL